MSFSIKKLYYILPAKEFGKRFDELQNNPASIHLVIGSNSYFFLVDDSVNALLMELHQAQAVFDQLLNSFSSFTRRQIIQSYFIDEIQGTNNIENIHSTRHDIFYAMKSIQNTENKHVLSITHAYEMLLNTSGIQINDLASLRTIYDRLMKDALESDNDKPDGKYFRKNAVFITNGMKPVLQGLFPEDAVNDAMLQFLQLYNNTSFDIYLRLVLSHFLLETIHPFYDGNGRFGRFLISNELFQQEKSYSAFLVSSSLNTDRSKYYKAFSAAEDVHEYGCLNQYTEILLSILLNGLKTRTAKLNSQKKIINEQQKVPDNWNKSEKIIYHLLIEAGAFTYFGISSNEIQKETGFSRRTVQYALSHMRSLHLLKEIKAGKFTFHKIES